MWLLQELDNVGRVLNTEGNVQTIRQRITRPHGTERWIESTVMNRLGSDRSGVVLSISHDITERRRQERDLRRRAMTDPLTGLPNRFALEAALADMVATDPGSMAGRWGGTGPDRRSDGAADRAERATANLTRVSVAPRYDLPMVENENEPFWTAVQERRLLIGRCSSCGEHHYYPRPHCPRCWSDDVEWVDAAGTATLYTWSVIHNNDLPPWPGRVPYIAAVVELSEGPRMMTHVVGAEGDDLSIGMTLEMEFVELDDELTIAAFHPA